MDTESKKKLLKLARETIEARFARRQVQIPQDPELQQRRGLFVSLHTDGELRGCIGYIRGFKSLVASVVEMAEAAAFHDGRFLPLRADELDDLEIEISVLSEMETLADPEDIQIGRDGLFLQHPHGSGLLLPQVPVEWHWDRPTFLRQICRKAGLPDKAWQDKGAQLFRFSAEVFRESDFS